MTDTGPLMLRLEGTTYTVEVALLLQDPEVPVTVYTVVTVGLTAIQVLVDAVLQMYVLAPEAQITTVSVLQIVEVRGLTVRLGTGRTVIEAVTRLLQPVVASVAVRVYIVDDVGEAVEVMDEGDDNPAVGSHE